jgi:hypothetical protein
VWSRAAAAAAAAAAESAPEIVTPSVFLSQSGWMSLPGGCTAHPTTRCLCASQHRLGTPAAAAAEGRLRLIDATSNDSLPGTKPSSACCKSARRLLHGSYVKLCPSMFSSQEAGCRTCAHLMPTCHTCSTGH